VEKSFDREKEGGGAELGAPIVFFYNHMNAICEGERGEGGGGKERIKVYVLGGTALGEGRG